MIVGRALLICDTLSDLVHDVIVQVYKVIKNLLTKRALGSIIIKLSDDADKCFTETSMKLKAHKAWNFSVAGDFSPPCATSTTRRNSVW